jgi:hypothetical protein
LDDNEEARQNGIRSGIVHSRVEMRALRRILRSRRKYKSLARYMPKIYHHNSDTGTVLMHKYRKPKTSPRFEAVCKDIEEKIVAITKDTKWASQDGLDLDNPGNIGRDEKGNLVLLDLGCFEQRGWQ